MNRGTTKLLVGGLAIAVAVATYMYLNRGYGELSELGYEYATAIYSACNQGDGTKLQKLSAMIAASREQNEIGDRETRWLSGIIARGERGDWQMAAAESRNLLMDQVHGR